VRQYFDNLDGASRQFNERIEAHRFTGEIETGQDPFDVVRQWLDGLAEISGDYVSSLQAIDAPAELEHQHLELVAAARELDVAIRGSLAQFDSVRSVAEAKEFFEHPFQSSDPALAEASAHLSAACAALQDAARGKGLEVTLMC
jgi:hypothetical protein